MSWLPEADTELTTGGANLLARRQIYLHFMAFETQGGVIKSVSVHEKKSALFEKYRTK